MSQSISIRTASAADVTALVALIESAYRGEVSRAGWTTEADLLDGQRTDEHEVLNVVRGPRSRVRIAEQHGSLVACVRIDDAGDAGYIGMFAVQPTMQAGGIGRQMLNEAERVIREELRLPRARMTVIMQRESLIAWYARRGYQVTGKREPFPYHDPRAGTPRRADLVFEVLEKPLQ
jgi:ribosomal protein S18 acetylase RimI-like enzyme